MARRLNLQAGILVAFALGLASAASAQALPDPTRPPAGFVETVGAGTGGGGAPHRDPGAPVDAAPKPSGPQLQSVVLPQSGHGRPVAIISGKYVPQGERFEGMELVSVTQQEAVLAAGKTRRVLKLTPGVEKTAPGGVKPEPRNFRPVKVGINKKKHQRETRGTE